ncbi:MAG: Rieske (2Fe-2S) protein [Deltaproteobacteria bacterium]|nr:Rieske (2Fe-2S) protein [Deltaproteobacteria bacterium]
MTEGMDAGRREFLKRGTLILGGLTLLGLAIPSGVYVLAPLWKRSEEEWVEVAAVSEVPVGQPTKIEFVRRKKDGWVTIEGRSSAWVVTADGRQFTAYDPRCTHLGCPYRFDAAQGKFLCPCHTAMFDIDGNVLSGPAPRPLDRFETKVVGKKLLIKPAVEKKEG